jgi:hypothetical protein
VAKVKQQDYSQEESASYDTITAQIEQKIIESYRNTTYNAEFKIEDANILR